MFRVKKNLATNSAHNAQTIAFPEHITKPETKNSIGSAVGVAIIYFLTLLDKGLRDLDHYIFTTTSFLRSKYGIFGSFSSR
jgi:hypothetical protein